MKVKITQGQANNLMDTLMKKNNISYNILYWNDNTIDKITGTVYLYKDGKVLGYNQGYEFSFKYDSRFNSLTPTGSYPKIHMVNLFKYIPEEVVDEYFTEKVKDYLFDYINKGYSGLRRN